MSESANLRRALTDLTLNELHDLHLAVAGPTGKAPRQKGELVSYLLSQYPRERLEKVAGRLEALEPYKHSWVFSMGSAAPKPVSASKLRSWSEKLWHRKFRSLEDLDPGSPSLQPTLWLHDEATSNLYIKFTHWVRAERWERISATRKELRTSTVRHPVVVTIRGQLGVAEVRFNGFSQGLATSAAERLSYESIAGEAVQLVGERLGVSFVGLHLAQAIDALLEAEPGEVRDIRRVVRPLGRGKIVLDAGETTSDIDVAAFLAEFLKTARGAVPDVSEATIREALRTTPPESVLLLWRRPAVLTRITFRELAPEILFIWRTGGRSSVAVDLVIRKLLQWHSSAGKPKPQDILNFISALPAGTTIRASELVQRFQVTPEQAFKSVEQARELDLLEPRYRVRTDRLLLHFENSWRASLADLPRLAEDEDGHQINLDHAANVEIGFLRTSTVA